MKRSSLVFILVGSLFLSCATGQSNSKLHDSVSEENQPIIFLGYQNMRLISNLNLVDKLSSEDRDKLKDWQIVPSDLENVLKQMELVNSTEWYARCYMFERWYIGTVSNGEKIYNMEVGASGYITLKCETEVLHFISPSDPLVFATPCDCCE